MDEDFVEWLLNTFTDEQLEWLFGDSAEAGTAFANLEANYSIAWEDPTSPESIELLRLSLQDFQKQWVKLTPERVAKAPPVQLGAPETSQGYLDTLKAWLSVAMQLGASDEQNASDILTSAEGAITQGRDITTLPYYKQMASGQDPAAFFQQTTTPFESDIAKFYRERQEEYETTMAEQRAGTEEALRSPFTLGGEQKSAVLRRAQEERRRQGELELEQGELEQERMRKEKEWQRLVELSRRPERIARF